MLLSAKVWSGERHGAADALPLTSFYRLALQLDPRRATPPAAAFELPRTAQTLTLTPAAPPRGCCR